MGRFILGGFILELWEGFREISREEAVEKILRGEEVFGVDDEGFEALIEGLEGLDNFDVYVVEKYPF